MAFKLSKAHLKRRDEIVTALIASKGVLLAAVSEYNKTLEDVREFFNHDIVGHFNDEFEDKSENWQEGERGEAVRSWIDGFEGVADNLEDIDLDDYTLDDHITSLEELEEEPSY